MREAAREGKWAPDTEASSRLQLKALEYFLCLPTPLFRLLAPFLLPLRARTPGAPQVRPSSIQRLFLRGAQRPDVLSLDRTQVDLHNGLQTSLPQTLGEMEEVAAGHNVATPILSAVLARVRLVAEERQGVQVHGSEELFRSGSLMRIPAPEA
jgi:hypothetical protein